MIYLRVELWPKGDRSRATLLGEATIENTGGTKTKANYRARISKKRGFKPAKKPKPAKGDPGLVEVLNLVTQTKDAEVLRVCRPASSSVWKETVVEAFPRSVRGVWDLLHRTLIGCVGGRN